MSANLAAKSVMSAVTWPKVFLFGDSITQFSFSADACWGSLVADYLQRKCDVINRGFSGYNTAWCKLILPRLISKQDATHTVLVTVFLGANDSNKGDLNPRQHVPLDEYKQNMTEMVDYLMSIGIARENILLITPPACDGPSWEAYCKERAKIFAKCNILAGKYAKGCVEVANECGTSILNLYDHMMKREDWKDMLVDGLHLSKAGSEFLFQLLKPLVDSHTSDLPLILPEWDKVDYQNPQTSLT